GRQAISRGEGWEHGLVLGRERTLPLLDELHVVAGSPVEDRLLHPLRQRLAVVRGTCPRGCDRTLVQRKRCLPTHTAHYTAARKAQAKSLPCAPAVDGFLFHPGSPRPLAGTPSPVVPGHTGLVVPYPVRRDRIRLLAISVTLATPVRCCLPLGLRGAGVFALVSATLPECSAATGR